LRPPASAYALTTTGKHQWASVAERPVALPPDHKKGRHMPKSQFLNFREIVRSAVETPHESEDILLLARNFRARAEEPWC
jgi:hypothetical protein